MSAAPTCALQGQGLQESIVRDADPDADPPAPETVTVTVWLPPSIDSGTVADAVPLAMLIGTVASRPVPTIRTCADVALLTDACTVPW